MKEQIKLIVEKILNIENSNVEISIPSNKENGDFSTNVAMKYAKNKEMSPQELAQHLVEQLLKEEIILSAEVAGPGFINMTVKKDYLFENLKTVLEEQEEYGHSDLGKNEKINVEFVSANPTGYLHVGTARGAAYGDSLCRILIKAGFDVTREYYFNDGGAQIINLGKSIQARYKTMCGEETEIPEDGYHGGEIILLAEQIYNLHKDEKISEDIEFFMNYGTKELIKRIKQDLSEFRVTFDVWTSEQDIRNSGNIEKCLELLKSTDDIYDEDGATWLKSTKYGDDKDRVLIKKDGNYTYLVPDIAYHLNKINRGFKEIIDIFGADHHGYVRRLKASVQALGYPEEKIHVKLLQMVRLLRSGEEIKMSKRTGQTVTMKELADEVGINAARYFFANHSLDTQMDFDIDLAVKNSNENPVYYVNYAHARINSILEEAKTRNIQLNINAEFLNNDSATSLLSEINQFTEVVETAAIKQEIHMITKYAYNLATAFHSYYGKEKILTDNIEETSAKLALIAGVKITLKNALNLIGVEALDKM